MFKEFKQFLLRGNVIDLAVGVVVGSAFGSVVNALVKDLITPFIAAIVKVPDFSALTFTIRGSTFMYGDFINVLLSFLLVSSAIFFFIIKPINILFEMSQSGKPANPKTKRCEECLSVIPIKAKRCSFCTQPVKSK